MNRFAATCTLKSQQVQLTQHNCLGQRLGGGTDRQHKILGIKHTKGCVESIDLARGNSTGDSQPRFHRLREDD